MDPLARGGARRYLDTTPPEEYSPDTGEVNLKDFSNRTSRSLRFRQGDN